MLAKREHGTPTSIEKNGSRRSAAPRFKNGRCPAERAPNRLISAALAVNVVCLVAFDRLSGVVTAQAGLLAGQIAMPLA